MVERVSVMSSMRLPVKGSMARMWLTQRCCSSGDLDIAGARARVELERKLTQPSTAWK
jgi:hypothetical protein